jgi:hypothetical protein
LQQFQDRLNEIASSENWAGKAVVLPPNVQLLPGGLTADDKAGYREQFEKGLGCIHCGGLHLRACRRVKMLKWRNREEPDSVEYWGDGKWDEAGIVWPEDVYDDALPDDDADDMADDGSSPEASA